MTEAVIKSVSRAFVKGTSWREYDYLAIDPELGVKHDRQIAIRRQGERELKSWKPTAWNPKGIYHVCMNSEAMAIERPILTRGDANYLSELDPDYAAELKHRLGEKEFVVQAAQGAYSLHDTEGAYVSFLNYASAIAFSQFYGRYVNPRRFRMNVVIGGLNAFEELKWVNGKPGESTREMSIGECRFRIDHECKRCRAPSADPVTGERNMHDLEHKLSAMMEKMGYVSPRGHTCVMGFLAIPLNSGIIQPGDRIILH